VERGGVREVTCRPAREERETGAFFPLSFSAVFAAVVLAARSPLPPFPAISSAPSGGNPESLQRTSQIRRRRGRIRADRGANRADLAADSGNRAANRGEGRVRIRRGGSSPYLSRVFFWLPSDSPHATRNEREIFFRLRVGAGCVGTYRREFINDPLRYPDIFHTLLLCSSLFGIAATCAVWSEGRVYL
jgi:hypothetical protein